MEVVYLHLLFPFPVFFDMKYNDSEVCYLE